MQTITTTKLTRLTLDLFNGVLVTTQQSDNLMIEKTVSEGYILHPSVAALENVEEIIDYLRSNSLTPSQLNKTFYGTWNPVFTKTRYQILIDQLLHYITTYGFRAIGIYSEDTVYLPVEFQDIPELKKIPLKVIKGYTNAELIDKCLDILKMGVALKQSTIEDLLYILNELEFKFTRDVIDSIKNKEAMAMIIRRTNVYPKSPVEFLRFLVFLITENTLLIKDQKSLAEIQKQVVLKSFNIEKHINAFGIVETSTIFNRFKDVFISFKNYVPNRNIINKLSKLSKVHHKPMSFDVLNNVTNGMAGYEQIQVALNSANPFRKIRLLYALKNRINTDSRVYHIRNGNIHFESKKSFPEEINEYKRLYGLVYRSLVENLSLTDKVIRCNENINYGLPSSEKSFIGNLPMGTIFSFESPFAVGCYWNEGIVDLDMSANGIGFKIGWNSNWKDGTNSVMYSGDVTRSPATEYLRLDDCSAPMLLNANIYHGNIGSNVKLIVGNAPGFGRLYVMNPNDVLFEEEITLESKNTIVGAFLPGNKYVLFHVRNGNSKVASAAKRNLLDFYIERYLNPISLSQILIDAGAKIVPFDSKDYDIDLTLENIQKDSILNLFK